MKKAGVNGHFITKNQLANGFGGPFQNPNIFYFRPHSGANFNFAF